MGKQKIRVLIADDNMDFCFLSKEQINMFDDMMCCGVAHDGNETICKINELLPDVVLLNQFMPILDGIGVMEHLKSCEIAHKPCVIITSITANEELIKHMLELGADYFLTKPFNMDTLARRIRLVVSMAQGKSTVLKTETNKGDFIDENSNEPFVSQVAKSFNENYTLELEKIISNTVISLGIPTNRLGYDYVRESVMMILTSNNARPTLRQTYETIANHHDSDVRCVENAIISVIKTSMQSPTPAMQSLIELLPINSKKTMSNGKFLTLLAQNIQFQQSK